tara:strand:+ start:44 stop:835 length:792 start_codon:yes stop_codon:yes gene_type:complete
MDLEMKEYIIVTGASGNFGGEVSRLLASMGKNLILISRRKNQSIVNSYPDVDIIDIQHNLNDDRTSLHLANQLNERYEISGVIYCSGGQENAGDWLSTIHSNLNMNTISYVSFVKVFIDKFIGRDRGFFVSCCSVGGYGNNYDLFNLYKFPLITITESLNHRLSVRGSSVKVYCLPICSLVPGDGVDKPIPKENVTNYARKMISHVEVNKKETLILSDECENSPIGDEILNIQNSMRVITEKEKEHFGWTDEQEKNYFNSSIL